MLVDVTSYLNANMATTTDEASSDLDKDDFLTLLVAQLEYQDPLDPVDSTEMVSQLAEYSSLEQLTNLNTAMEDLMTMVETQTMIGAASYMGKEVEASGYTIAKDGSDVSDVTYILGEDAESVTAYVYDEDGDLVDTVSLGAADAGSHTFSWDGDDYDGDELADGTYLVGFEALDEYDDAVSVSARVTGTVTAVRMENGETILTLDDGREVSLLQIWSVTDTTSTASNASI